MIRVKSNVGDAWATQIFCQKLNILNGQIAILANFTINDLLQSLECTKVASSSLFVKNLI